MLTRISFWIAVSEALKETWKSCMCLTVGNHNLLCHLSSDPLKISILHQSCSDLSVSTSQILSIWTFCKALSSTYHFCLKQFLGKVDLTCLDNKIVFSWLLCCCYSLWRPALYDIMVLNTGLTWKVALFLPWVKNTEPRMEHKVNGKKNVKNEECFDHWQWGDCYVQTWGKSRISEYRTLGSLYN